MTPSAFSCTGQERYGNMTRVYYREAVGALVVFDMTRLSTFQAVLKWKGDLDSKVKKYGRERNKGMKVKRSNASAAHLPNRLSSSGRSEQWEAGSCRAVGQ